VPAELTALHDLYMLDACQWRNFKKRWQNLTKICTGRMRYWLKSVGRFVSEVLLNFYLP